MSILKMISSAQLTQIIIKTRPGIYNFPVSVVPVKFHFGNKRQAFTMRTPYLPLENIYRKISLSSVKNGWTKEMAFGHKLWTTEKSLSTLLLGLIPITIAYPTQTGDYLLALTLLLHSHWALESVALDYIRPDNFGKFMSKGIHWVLIAINGATLAGLFYFVYNDVGISNGIRRIWAIKPSSD